MSKVSKTIFAIVIILHFAITIMLAYKLNIWVDEGFSLRTTEGDIGNTIKRALNFELQAPLYYVLLNLWRNLNSSIFFARLFSILCISLSVYFSGKLSLCIFKEIHHGWLAAFVAFNPFSIWAATEIRCYALVILFTALLLYFFYKAFLEETSQYLSILMYLFLAVLALYTHYYLGFLLVANAFCLLYEKNWKSLRIYLLGMIFVSLCFAPMIFIILDQLSYHPGMVHTNFPLLKSLAIVGLRVLTYILPINQKVLSSSSYFEVDFLYYIPFCIVIIYFSIIKFDKIVKSYAMPMSIILIISSAFFLIIHQISEPYLFFLKHTSVLFLASLYTIFFLLVAIGNKRLFYFILCSIFLIYTPTIFFTLKSPSKIGDYERVSSYIMLNEQRNQPILAFRSEIAIPLSYYYNGLNDIVPIPDSYTSANYQKQAINDVQEIINAISSIPGMHQNLWITTDTYTYRDRYLNTSFNRHILEHFIDSYCAVIKSKKFSGTHVRFVRFNEQKLSQLKKKYNSE